MVARSLLLSPRTTGLAPGAGDGGIIVEGIRNAGPCRLVGKKHRMSPHGNISKGIKSRNEAAAIALAALMKLT